MHATDDMEDVKNKRCNHPGCNKQPNFGIPGGRPTRCKMHATCDMEDIKHNQCDNQGCKKIPSYGIPGGRPTRCKMHAIDDMEDVVNKRCGHMGCRKIPSYGIPGGRSIMCKMHATDDMEDVKNKRCNHPGCNKQPNFGIPGGRPTRCKMHATCDMEDIKHNQCDNQGCKKRSTYGNPGECPTKCKTHAYEGMEDVVNKICEHDGCKKIPVYGIPGGLPSMCKMHAEIGMENIVSRRCPGYNGIECPVICFLQNGKDYCLSCDPDEDRRIIKKKDEHAFFAFLEKHHLLVMTQQYRVDYRCVETSKKYALIDGVIVTPDIVICLEVDENGHKDYDIRCDAARTQWVSEEILLAYPKHDIAWVRVNPTSTPKCKKVRSARFLEAVSSIQELLETPQTVTVMIGFGKK
jgi:hypothetical protein